MQLLYNIAGIIVVFLIIPVFLVRSVREKGFVERIRQSLGFFPEHALDKVEKKDCIWVHAASVGEIVATSPIIKEFRKEFPRSPILVSVVTTSGYEMANRIIKDADAIIYFPLDLPFVAAHVMRRIHPRVFLPVETELWPNFLKTARQLRIPVMMVNGRISDRSVKQYKHLHSLLRILAKIRHPRTHHLHLERGTLHLALQLRDLLIQVCNHFLRICHVIPVS